MSLEEEIELNRFGQGLVPVEDLLRQYREATEEEQSGLYSNVSFHLMDFDPDEESVRKALEEAGVAEDDHLAEMARHAYLKRKKFVKMSYPVEPSDQAYHFLLCLFRADYQQRFAAENDQSKNWWFWDLSDPKVIDAILTTRRNRVDAVYNDPGYRGEFEALAKLHYEDKRRMAAQFKEPDPKAVPVDKFLNYDELLTESLKVNKEMEKFNKPIFALNQALYKALSRQLGLDEKETRAIMAEVVDRHMREKYGEGYFDVPKE
ncbi:DUF5958 family protein [Larkinella soli]|uniref:DUF5958 family protein n=1 Tax=Larkinella soli TaxID=1770527 RepID=UPI000FFC4236|nr:DUF5958 family protein [Larkinella soli]